MAQITTLKNREGMALYPLTSSKAVLDEGGVDMDTRLAGKVEKVPGKGLSSNDFSDAEKLKLEGLPTSGVLEERFTGKQEALQDSVDVVLSEGKLTVTEAAKRQLFDDMWIEAGKIYNKQFSSIDRVSYPENPYILNGISHTYEDAVHTFMRTAVNYEGNLDGMFHQDKRLKTNFPLQCGALRGTSAVNMFNSCSSLEVAVLNVWFCYPSSTISMFLGCSNLIEVRGEIQLGNIEGYKLQYMFSGCVNLEEFRINGFKGGIDLHWSPKLSYATMLYLVSHKDNTTAATITVHGDVYAKLTGDTSNAAAAELTTEELAAWGGVLAAAVGKNIQFATT